MLIDNHLVSIVLLRYSSISPGACKPIRTGWALHQYRAGFFNPLNDLFLLRVRGFCKQQVDGRSFASFFVNFVIVVAALYADDA